MVVVMLSLLTLSLTPRFMNNDYVTTEIIYGASLVAQPAMRETWVQSLGWEEPLEKEQLPTLVFWPGEFHDSPWG